MRNGLLSAAALLLGSSTALAQYWPTYPAPAMVPAPHYGRPMGPAPYPAHYYPNYPNHPTARMSMPVMPAVRRPAPSYLPHNYFPGAAGQAPQVTHAPLPVQQPVTIIHEGSSPPILLQPDAPTLAPSVPAKAASAKKGAGPGAYFEILPGGLTHGGIGYGGVTHGGLTDAPAEPVTFHRQCNESCWVGADFILGWIRRGPLGVPLLTTSTTDDPAVFRGALGQPGTIVLFGDRDLSFGLFSGLRVEAGLWLDQDNRYSLDISGFYLFPRHIGRTEVSDGSTVLGRPIFNVSEGQFDEDVFLIADRDAIAGRTIAGRVSIDTRSEIYGAELNGRWHGYWKKRLHAEALAGLRGLRLVESLNVVDSLKGLQPGFVTFRGAPIGVGDFITEQDSFRCSNTFYGFQAGGRMRWESDWFHVDAFAKLGLGLTYQNIEINGQSSLTSGGVVVDRAPGGILALPSNIGEYDRTRFGVVPEVGLSLGVELSDNVRLKAGYSVLLWSAVARPGDQIDRNINTGQVPGDQFFGTVAGLPSPQAPLREHAFWLHMLNLGVEFHY
jgi:hypothetical protein